MRPHTVRRGLSSAAVAAVIAASLLFASHLFGQTAEPQTTPMVALPMVALIDAPAPGTMPRTATAIDAVGTHGAWQPVYPGGFESDSLAVPANEPVHLRLRTAQAGYRLVIADSGIDVPVPPGGPVDVWLMATGAGELALDCGECGELGSSRDVLVIVMRSPDYREYVDTWGGTRDLSLGQRGELLFANFGCADCHRLGGASDIAGSPTGLWGQQVLLEDGSMVDVHGDEGRAFLAESIREPDAAYTAGYMSGTMPALAERMSDSEIEALVQFIRCMGHDPCSDPACVGLRGCSLTP